MAKLVATLNLLTVVAVAFWSIRAIRRTSAQALQIAPFSAPLAEKLSIIKQALLSSPQMLHETPDENTTTVQYSIHEYTGLHPSRSIVEYAIEAIPEGHATHDNSANRDEDVIQDAPGHMISNTGLSSLQRARRNLETALESLRLRKSEYDEEFEKRKAYKDYKQKENAKEIAAVNKRRAELQEQVDSDNETTNFAKKTTEKVPIYFLALPRLHGKFLT